MPRSHFIRPACLGLALLCTSLSAQAQEWSLDGDASSLYYLTSKAAAITELNTFTELSGDIKGGRLATLDISLSSVDTSIPIRDQRMQEILFRVSENPLASVEVDVSQLELAELAPGETLETSMTTAFSLNGVTNSLETDFRVTALENNDLLVANTTPLIISAASYGLADGVEELREVAGLPSINNNVVVTFSLVYRSQ